MGETTKKRGRPAGLTWPCGWGCGAELKVSELVAHFRSCSDHGKVRHFGTSEEPPIVPSAAGEVNLSNLGLIFESEGIALNSSHGNTWDSIPITRPWLPELKRIYAMTEYDPDSAKAELDELLGPGFNKVKPKHWGGLDVPGMAKWLDKHRPLKAR